MEGGSELIALRMDADLIERIDRARDNSSRSQFIREAIGERLKRLGFEIPAQMVNAPDRVRYSTQKKASFVLNEKVSSSKAAERRDALDAAERAADFRAPKSPRSPATALPTSRKRPPSSASSRATKHKHGPPIPAPTEPDK